MKIKFANENTDFNLSMLKKTTVKNETNINPLKTEIFLGTNSFNDITIIDEITELKWNK
jgi:hypothetical protein